MAERRNADRGLIDGLTAALGGPRTSALLSKLDKAVPWEALAVPIAALPAYAPKRSGADRRGRPARPVVTMLKCVLLAKWFGLSDPQLEECLSDRLSLRRFVGLSLTERPRPARRRLWSSASVCAPPGSTGACSTRRWRTAAEPGSGGSAGHRAADRGQLRNDQHAADANGTSTRPTARWFGCAGCAFFRSGH